MIVTEKQVKDYLSASKIGKFTINPYVGCPHACKYCYASFMKRFSNHPEPWGDFIDIKRCDKKININQISGKNVFMSSVTDCYNSYEAKYKITQSILEQLVDSDCYLQIATKNKLILRDLDLLKRIKHLSVAISINTLDENFRNDMDKGSSIQDRLITLKTLHENGIYTILFMSPVFIHITDWKAIIEVSKEYVSEYWFENLNLRGGFKSSILSYIKEKYSHYYLSFEQIYVKGKNDEFIELENKIKKYCDDNNISFTDYFHHSEVIKNTRHEILGKNRS